MLIPTIQKKTNIPPQQKETEEEGGLLAARIESLADNDPELISIRETVLSPSGSFSPLGLQLRDTYPDVFNKLFSGSQQESSYEAPAKKRLHTDLKEDPSEVLPKEPAVKRQATEHEVKPQPSITTHPLFNDIFINAILPFIGSKDRRSIQLTSKNFLLCCREAQNRQLSALFSKEILSSFGIVRPSNSPSPQETALVLSSIKSRIEDLRKRSSEDQLSGHSTEDLVVQHPPELLLNFFQTKYNQSLRTVFETLAHVSRRLSLEESTQRIHEWINKNEARLERIHDISIFLSNEQISCMPREIGRLAGLSRLQITQKPFANLPAEIGQLTNLQTLSLGGNQLTHLPAEIGQLSSLDSLYLERNQLTHLPSEIGQLAHLQYISLSNNRLTRLPAEIGRLTQLKDLHLNDNQLVTLPPEIGQLSSLESLYLGGNKLSHLPDEVGQLSKLVRLELHNNQLTSIPISIGQLSKLAVLFLSGNRLSILPSEISTLPSLNLLSCTNNPLTTFPAGLKARLQDGFIWFYH